MLVKSNKPCLLRIWIQQQHRLLQRQRMNPALSQTSFITMFLFHCQRYFCRLVAHLGKDIIFLTQTINITIYQYRLMWFSNTIWIILGYVSSCVFGTCSNFLTASPYSLFIKFCTIMCESTAGYLWFISGGFSCCRLQPHKRSPVYLLLLLFSSLVTM